MYARAVAGIAKVWGARQQFAIVAPSEAGPKAIAAAEIALELDSTLAEVQHASASIKTWVEWDWAGAEEAFERTIEIDPNYPGIRAAYSHFLNIVGRAEDAMLQIERGLELDPFDVHLQMFHGASLVFQDRYDEAIAVFEGAPNHPLAINGMRSAFYGKGEYEEALAIWKLEAAATPEVLEVLDPGYAAGGYSEASLRAAAVEEGRLRTTYVRPTWLAVLYAVGGEHDRAFEWLERAFEMREPNLPYLNMFPELDGLHEDLRWRDLLRRMGLPP